MKLVFSTYISGCQGLSRLIFRGFYLLHLSLLIMVSSNAQVNQHLTTYNGLSNNSMTYIFKDSRGFIWIGTTDGLNRYDGNSFVVYKHNPTSSNTISDNFISSINEDVNGNIWIGTQGSGLNRFNPEHDKFTAFFHSDTNVNSLPSDYIFHHSSLVFQNDTMLWIGTDNGLCNLNINTLKIKRVGFNIADSNNYKDIRVIFNDRNNFIWAGTNTGLLKLDDAGNILKIYKSSQGPNIGLSNNIITAITENDNELWIGTEYGLNELNLLSGKIKWFFSQRGNKNSLSDNSITSLQKDGAGCIWIGTKSGGANKYDPLTGEFSFLRKNASTINTISDNYIDYIYYDQQGLLWLGTVNAGINVVDVKTKKFTLFRNDPTNPNSLSYNTIRSVYEDIDGVLWIGTYGGGISRYDGKNFRHLSYDPDNQNTLGHNIVSAFYEDDRQNIWIGTWGGGINIINKKTLAVVRKNLPVGQFINDIYGDHNGNICIGGNSGLFIYDVKRKKILEDNLNDKLTSKAINSIYQDAGNNFWIATWHGLNKITIDQKSYGAIHVEHFKKDIDNDNSLSEDRLTTICNDSRGNIWVGTYGGGINKIVLQHDSAIIRYYNINNGLSGNIVYGILEDGHGNLWISTNNGLSKFNIDDERFHNFDINDGLQGNQFYWNAFAKGKNGAMYFGGINGLNKFHPDSITYAREFPRVAITGLLLFNKPVQVMDTRDGRAIIEKSIMYSSSIELKRKDYAFTLEFAALTFKSQSKIRYAYKLENFDPDWIETDYQKRFATYSHLRPGNYTFKVKSTNADGQWNDAYVALDVKILPAYYETIWAFIVYAIILLFLLINFRAQILARARYKHDIQLARLEKQNAEAYNDMKLQFFTNVSHEFKTPLTLILGPLENVLGKKHLDHELTEQLNLMKNGSKRLYRLINQLMEFRKVETGKYKLNIQNKDITEIINETCEGFKARAKQNKIEYVVDTGVKNAKVWFDVNVVETIVFNLLSNAFKFTGGQGGIYLGLKFKNVGGYINNNAPSDIQSVEIHVKDSGIGIEKARVENIFQRFYQAERFADQKRGTGIGLALTKDLVEVHKGKITVESELGTGTAFIVELPVSKEFFSGDEINETPSADNNLQRVKSEIFGLSSGDEVKYIDSFNFNVPNNKNAPEILIVEDDIELIGYMGKILEKGFRLRIAYNGEQGLQMALEKEPDLILSDIMMPKMSGLEMCEKIKTDIRISHVPVILLTALAENEDMVSGYGAGADAYIPKPFHQGLLLARINNLIEQREKLRINIQKKFHFGIDTQNLPSVDEKFIKKLNGYIQDNISEVELNVESLSRELGLSATHLYRKVKALTGFSTNELIRRTRLNKAASLMATKQGSVSEIMYAVGFNNSSYFARCFQEEFGVLPSEYIEKK